MKKDIRLFILSTSFVATSLFVSCQKTETTSVVLPVIPFAEKTYLREVSPFPVGAAVAYDLVKSNASYQQIVKDEMTSITVENAQKWGIIHPKQNVFAFEQADLIVDWAKTNGKRVHGHNLLWHAYLPDWINKFQGDSVAWENIMKTHIQTVVKHFKGKVTSWDVVNEAFTDKGKLRVSDGRTDDNSIWAQKLGKDYVARAFQYAREADPDVLLFYNDYGQEGSVAKTQAILDMVADFKRRNIPINGLGLQFHIGVSQSEASLTQAIRQMVSSGLLVHISELDVLVSDWQKNPNLVYSDALQQKQSDKYKFLAQQYKQLVPKAQQFGITTWNVTDADSWIPALGYTDWPLLFDKDYLRKKAYYGFSDGLKN